MTERIADALSDALARRSRQVLTPPDKTLAAVMVPLLAVDGEPSLLYIRRSTRLPHHQGQVAFPGGTFRAGHDPDLIATALREAEEEIGLAREHVRLLGALDDIETVSSRFVITPVVALAPHPYAWRPCPVEVDAVFTVPLRTLLAPDVVRRETWDFDGRRVPVDTYPVAGHIIWGATQRITQNLLTVVGGLG